MFSLPDRSGWMPARTSRRAPIRPCTLIFPTDGNVVWQIILSRVDLPDPFTPMMPWDLPGSTWRLTSRRTQRQSRVSPRMRLPNSRIFSCNSGAVRSDRNRFHTLSTRTVPSGHVGKVHLEPLEHGEAHHHPDKGPGHGHAHQTPVGAEAVDHGPTDPVDRLTDRIQEEVQRLPRVGDVELRTLLVREVPHDRRGEHA